MGHRVIAIDPAKWLIRDFNILDWLDPASATADADVRSVVDWICGATASGNGQRCEYERRGAVL